jgi:L-lysine exporter family protein LysE/ArgO
MHFQSALAGMGFGLSLIVAIGAQNAFVLRQGLLRRHVPAVVAICALSDAVLIAVGVGGLGKVFQAHPSMGETMRIAGAVFLTAYGLATARRVLRPSSLSATHSDPGRTLLPTCVTALALTWLNPHVYLDTVLLLGSVANSYGSASEWFGVGAATGSVLWFTLLGFGARWLQPLFAKPFSWRVLDAAIAIIMWSIAVSLILH